MDKKRMLKLVGIAVLIAVVGAWAGVSVQERMARVAQAQGSGTGGPPPGTGPYTQPTKYNGLDVPYVPTPQPVVDEMLKMASVTSEDVVYDLGCGDGRIVVTAAKQFGARGVGVDIDPERIKESNANASAAGVTDRVTFVKKDLFKLDLTKATVVTLYLLPEINLKLRPKLFKELKPGTRVVSHDFDMGDWKPKNTVKIRDQREHTLHFWTIPEKKDQPPTAQAPTSG
jgi:SAM-dependent methyltransferase